MDLRRILFSPIGPETDPGRASRSGLARAGAVYLAVGAVSAVVLVLVEHVSPTGDLWRGRADWTGETSPIAFMLAVCFGLAAVVGLGGGVWLLFRALFMRSRAGSGERRIEEDD